MLRCICCDTELRDDVEFENGYCFNCQMNIRQVFDKDAHILGQSSGTGSYNLGWTNIKEEN